ACDCVVLSKIASWRSSTSRRPSGRWTPARVLTSVDLPAPFSRTRPCTSPPNSSISPSSSAWTAPKLFWACSRESTGPECGVVTIVAWRGAARRRPSSSLLELELVDVLDGEREGRSENHLRPPVRTLDVHVLDPRVLVRGRRGRRQNRELTLVVHQLAQELDLVPADRLGVRLVDEERPAVDVRVERYDLRALRLGLLERGTHALWVVAGDD